MDRRYFLHGAALFSFCGGLAAQETPEKTAGVLDDIPPADDIGQHPRCVICNMDRRRYHHARHLLVYADTTVQGTCSVHCAADCMLRERRRGFHAIFAPDFGSQADPKPLLEASTATYLIGSDLRGVMTRISKVSFADRSAALAAQQVHGGVIGSFDTAVASSMRELGDSMARRYAWARERRQRGER